MSKKADLLSLSITLVAIPDKISWKLYHKDFKWSFRRYDWQ